MAVTEQRRESDEDLAQQPVVVRGTPVVPRRTRWRAVLLAVVVLFAGAELGTRAVEDRLPPASGWISDEYPAKRDRIAQLAASGGTGVVLLGSSVVDVAVDPALLSEAATGDRGAYNAGLIAATPRIVETWGRELVVPELRPDTVVVAVSSRDLNGNGAGMRVQDQRFRASLGGQWLLDSHSIADGVEWWFHEHSALVRHRNSIRRPLESLWGYDGPDRNRTELTEHGLETHLLEESYRAEPAVLDFFRQEPLRDFAVTHDQLGALRRLLGWLEASGIRAVVLDVPVTDDYVGLHPEGGADLARYVSAVDEVASAAGAEVLRPGRWPAELFSDPLHLNRGGVDRLTAELDRFLVSPPG